MLLVCLLKHKNGKKIRNKGICTSVTVYIDKEIIYKIIQIKFTMEIDEMYYHYKRLNNCLSFVNNLIFLWFSLLLKMRDTFCMTVDTCHYTVIKNHRIYNTNSLHVNSGLQVMLMYQMWMYQVRDVSSGGGCVWDFFFV